MTFRMSNSAGTSAESIDSADAYLFRKFARYSKACDKVLSDSWTKFVNDATSDEE